MTRKKKNKITYTPDGGNVLRGIERFNKATSADITGVGTSGATSAGEGACCEELESNVSSIVYDIRKSGSDDSYEVYFDLPDATIAQKYPGITDMSTVDETFGPYTFKQKSTAEKFISEHKQRNLSEVPRKPEVQSREIVTGGDGSAEYFGKVTSDTVEFIYCCPNCSETVDLPERLWDSGEQRPISDKDSERVYVCSACGDLLDLAGIKYWDYVTAEEPNYNYYEESVKSKGSKYINIREALNELDKRTYNMYDLLNLYEALPSTNPKTQQELKAIATDLTTNVSNERQLAAKLAAKLTQIAGGDMNALSTAVSDDKRLLDKQASEIKAAASDIKSKSNASNTSAQQGDKKFTEEYESTQECSTCLTREDILNIIR